MSIDHGKVLALAKKLAPLKAMPFEFDNGPGGDDQWCVCTKDSNLTGCDMDKEDAELFAYAVNALAQPAEAVELPTPYHYADGGKGEPLFTANQVRAAVAVATDAAPAEAVEGDETDPTALQIEYARGYGDGVKHGEQLRPTAAVSPEELRLYVSEQEACELERSHDAAQGAVAPFGWLHEIKWTDGWGSPKYVHGPDKPKPHIEQCDADMRHLVEPLVDGERFTPLYAHPQAAPAQGASLRHANPHLTKESVERNVRSSSALEGISTNTFQAASAGDEE